MFRCLCYGAGSAGLAVLFEDLAKSKFPLQSEDNPQQQELKGYNFWVHMIVMYGPTVIVSTAEALVIYYDLLRTSIAVTQIAQLKLFPQDPIRTFVSNSIVSEALELGHPTYVRFGINPMVGASELVLKACFLLYKARGGLSKFLIKVRGAPNMANPGLASPRRESLLLLRAQPTQILLKRVLSRSALKGVFPLVGLPIVAFWDALLAANVLQAVRTVALGRCCIVGVTDALLEVHQELVRQMDAGMELSKAVELSRISSHALGSRHDTFDPTAMSVELKEAIMRSVAMAVVRARSFHPNLELLIKHLMYRLRIDPTTIEKLDVEDRFKECLTQLTMLEKYMVLTVLTFALILDGEVTISQRVRPSRAPQRMPQSSNRAPRRTAVVRQVCAKLVWSGPQRRWYVTHAPLRRASRHVDLWILTRCVAILQPAFMRLSRKFNNLMLRPEDVVFCMHSTREKDDESAKQLTFMEQTEAAIGMVLNVLTF
jgi:hypothetical protein